MEDGIRNAHDQVNQLITFPKFPKMFKLVSLAGSIGYNNNGMPQFYCFWSVADFPDVFYSKVRPLHITSLEQSEVKFVKGRL